jgi:exosortase K
LNVAARSRFLTAAPAVILAVAAAVALQNWYVRAALDDLRWILAPTAFLTGLFSGTPYFSDPVHGYVDPGMTVAIGKNCSGVNFFVTAFLLGVLSTVHRFRSFGGRMAVLAGVAVSSFLLTVIANASRITGAVAVLTLRLPWRWPGKESIHLAEGMAVFVSFLVLYYFMTQYVTGRIKS